MCFSEMKKCARLVKSRKYEKRIKKLTPIRNNAMKSPTFIC